MSHEQLLDSYRRHLTSDLRVRRMVVTGSLADGGPRLFSDVDLWVVVDEQLLGAVCADLPAVAESCGPLIHLSRDTPTHFMALYEDLLVADVNVVTEATYYSLGGDRRDCRECQDHAVADQATGDGLIGPEPAELVGRAVLQMLRMASKIHSGQYWVVPRQAQRLRESALLPLLQAAGDLPEGHLSSVDYDDADPTVRQFLIDSYPHPTRESSTTACAATLKLLMAAARRLHGSLPNPSRQLLRSLEDRIECSKVIE